MTQLNRLKLNGYKSIRSLDIELNALNVVIGANGAGKSNLISFLQMLQKVVRASLKGTELKQKDASHILYHGSQQTSQLTAELSFSNDNNYAYSVLFSINEHDQLYKQSDTTTGSLDEVYRQICDWQFYRFHQANDLSVVNTLKDIYINHPMHYKRIVSTLKQILPFFGDFIWNGENQTEDAQAYFYWKEKGCSMTFNTSHMSDGMVRMISLITLLLQPNLPALICIDEPELGLHPYAINVISGLLQSVALETQVIVSTQSVTLLDEFDMQDIIVVDRKEGQSTFERLDITELAKWIQDYSLGELWQKNILGGRPS
ncbi:AAA family ATPase [Desulfuribacillus alkaliarsenatis]|uniref:ATPase AAA-type core domain-containing protein n=1 Tax=Desulfuribacillus alkaliarsenatis TaxID=766136 RepID=A0A1E5G4Y0_9FIRM|nr:AAA family ATPase [Desulfuribacillus alkaliarsenatis]OEF97734.1 hypothetical protein BHF68_14150 [Desulfuribacillus alkaliarsenatis]